MLNPYNKESGTSPTDFKAMIENTSWDRNKNRSVGQLSRITTLEGVHTPRGH